MGKNWIGLFFSAALIASPAWATEDCQLQRYASFPLVSQAGMPLVPVNFAGKDVEMALSLNSQFSGAPQAWVDELHLSQGHLRSGTLHIGNRDVEWAAKVPFMQIGALKIASPEIMVLPPEPDREGYGLLGTDILSVGDVELDPKNGTLNLYLQNTCGSHVVYWSTTAAILPFKTDSSGHIYFDMELDGKPITVAVMLSSAQGRMALENAYDLFGIDKSSPGVVPVAPQKEGDAPQYRYPFKTLALGGLTISNPDIHLFDQASSGRTCNPPRCQGRSRLSLGFSEIRQLHLYFAFGQKKLYATAADAHL